ncbi:DoxX family protein [Aureimonas leprariae]|uniref:DoxX family protein n=1 Tax=Plantimonas leprariae TaxID=2615207 RepID=A0A7V7PP61_9HYPH|nr:DoxX family protein [Aureimonas leprariae]KAB0679758.1 DoxX family protein [Aureimonas leprariae]
MPSPLARLVDAPWFGVLARIVLTFAFWGSGLSKLIDFRGGVAEMAMYGLQPAVAFNIACIVTLIGGSLLVILNRWTWLGCGALAVFTALTIPIVHHFWTMTDPQEAMVHFFFVAEHVSVIGGLMVMAILSRRTRPATASAAPTGFVPAE